jgi:hypothetical protein
MNTQETIAQAKQATEAAKTSLLKTFEFVPEDKIGWSPSKTARTAVNIVAHCGMANGAFAALLRGEPLPLPASPDEAMALIRAAGRDITSREAAVKLVEDSTADLLRALDGVTDARMQTTPASPFGALPFSFWMQVPAEHMGGHARQIDYLETIWGDHEDHG